MYFQQQFESRIDKAKEKYLKDVGKTEWVIMSTNLLRHIQQQEFCHDWTSQSMYETEKQLFGLPDIPPTGEQFYRQISGAIQDYGSAPRQRDKPKVEHQVIIDFRPTIFQFIFTIKPPYLQ